MVQIMRLADRNGDIFYPQTHVEGIIGYEGGSGTVSPHTHNASDVNAGTLSNDRLKKATTTQQGITQLNDTLISESTFQALAANQGRILKNGLDEIESRLPIYTSWTSLPLGYGWAPSSSNNKGIRIYRDRAGFVHIDVDIVRTSSNNPSYNVASIPVEYRPVGSLAFHTFSEFNTAMWGVGGIGGLDIVYDYGSMLPYGKSYWGYVCYKN